MLSTSRSFTAWLLAAAVAGLIGLLAEGPLAGLVLGAMVVLAAVFTVSTPAATYHGPTRRDAAPPGDEGETSDDPAEGPLVLDRSTERPHDLNGTGDPSTDLVRSGSE
jgi:hypothetical protein